jgi:hypothetical protein
METDPFCKDLPIDHALDRVPQKLTEALTYVDSVTAVVPRPKPSAHHELLAFHLMKPRVLFSFI